MSREDAHKLLGGYATGTLTAAEQRTLFAAALEDQELFDALAREQALRDLLADPAARAQVLAAVDEAPVAWYRKLFRPFPVTAMAGALTALVAVGVWQANLPVRPTRIAKLDLPPAIARSEPAPAFPPAPEVRQKPTDFSRSFSIPGVPPATSPPPPPAAAREEKSAVAGGGVVGGILPDRATYADSPKDVRVMAGAAPVARIGAENGALRGVVTDANGAAIPSASVDVKSLASGEVVHAPVNQRGEFTTPDLIGLPYEISAVAPGFRKTVVSNFLPSNDPLQVKLEVGAVSEAVVVQVAAPANGTGGRGGSGGRAANMLRQQAADQQSQQGLLEQNAMQQNASQLNNAQQLSSVAATAEAAPQPYRLYRRAANNELLPVADGEAIARGSKLLLRVIPPQDGSVQLSESSGRQIVTRQTKSGQAVDIDLPNYSKPGIVDLRLRFLSSPTTSQPAAMAKKTETPAMAAKSKASVAETPAFTIRINIR